MEHRPAVVLAAPRGSTRLGAEELELPGDERAPSRLKRLFEITRRSPRAVQRQRETAEGRLAQRATCTPTAADRAPCDGRNCRWLRWPVTSTALPALDAHRLRADFAVFEELFDGKPWSRTSTRAASTQKPRQVLDRMRTFYETRTRTCTAASTGSRERATEGFEGARREGRGLLNAPSEKEIIFTRSATEAINLVAYAWGLDNLGPGDVVVITELEHHSNFVPWQYIAQAHRRRASAYIPIDDLGELQLDALDAIARDGNVKVVANNLVSNSLGTINPIDELAAWAHEQGAIMVVDAAQAAPHRRVDVQALDADFVAISSHKLCGPTGVGALWGRGELLEEMAPFNLGGEMIRSVAARGDDLQRPAAQVRGGHAGDRRGGRHRRGDRLHLRDRPRRDRAARARAGRAGAWARSTSCPGCGLGPPAGAPRRDRVVRRRGDPPARRGADPRLGRRLPSAPATTARQPLMTRLGVSATTRASFYLYSIPEEIDRLIAGLHKVKTILG